MVHLTFKSNNKLVFYNSVKFRAHSCDFSGKSLTNSRGSRVAGPKSRSRVQSSGRGSNVAAGENDLGFEVTE